METELTSRETAFAFMAKALLLACLLQTPIAPPAKAAVPLEGKLHMTIVNEATGAPFPARVHLKNATGAEIETTAYPDHKGHFTCPGSFELALPAGEYRYEAEHGQQFSLAAGTVWIRAGATTEHIARLRELLDITEEGWWSGDLHVHRPIEHMELLMNAEDIHVAPSITWWNQKSIWEGENAAPADPLVRFDGIRCNHVMAGEDEREGGALLYFHLNKPLNIKTQDREFPSPMKFLAEAREHAQVHVDIEKPFWWDAPIWLASGKIDTIGIANNHMCRDWVYNNPNRGGEAWGRPRDVERLPHPHGNGLWTQEIYYHALNAGLRIPPSAGSASGVLPNPLGYNRVWVHVGATFDHDLWWKNLRAGRSFVSNGPLLRCEAGGRTPGHVFKAENGKTLTIPLNAKIFTRDAISQIEIIKNGRIAATVPFDERQKSDSLGNISFTESGWFIVRAITDNPVTFRFASTAPFYVEFSDQRRRVSKASAQFFLDWVRERMKRVKLADFKQREAVLKHHRDAEAFWSEKVAKATSD